MEKEDSGNKKRIVGSKGMDRIKNWINRISFLMVMFLFLSVIIVGIFIQANYDFGDFPYFQTNTVSSLLFRILVFFSILTIMFWSKKIKRRKLIVCILFLVVAFSVIIMIPLYPFSDMRSVYEVAANDMIDINGYLGRNWNLVATIAYVRCILYVFGKSVWGPKIVNVLLSLCILFLTEKIYFAMIPKERVQERNTTGRLMWYMFLFLPVFFYGNRIYNDVIATTLCMIILYVVISEKNRGIGNVFLIILSVLQYMLRQSGIIFIIAIFMYLMLVRREYKKSAVYLICCIVGILSLMKINTIIWPIDTSDSPNVWSFLQMGINEAEFGFQDQSHSSAWTMTDYLSRYRELGVGRTLKIFAKKTLWMWSEGTYQAQRYGMGTTDAVYLYDTIITRNLQTSYSANFRVITENWMKAQYYVYLLFAIIGVWNNKNNEKSALLRYIICGFFCFYLLWEIKSRYIYSLYPIMMVFSFDGWLCLERKWIRRKL